MPRHHDYLDVQATAKSSNHGPGMCTRLVQDKTAGKELLAGLGLMPCDPRSRRLYYFFCDTGSNIMIKDINKKRHITCTVKIEYPTSYFVKRCLVPLHLDMAMGQGRRVEARVQAQVEEIN